MNIIVLGSTSPPTDSCANCRRSSIKVSQDGLPVNLSSMLFFSHQNNMFSTTFSLTEITVGPDGCFDITAACRPNVPIFLVVFEIKILH